jgi:hypothetical protein
MAIHTCQQSQPTANSLQAYASGEFAGTSYSLTLQAIIKKTTDMTKTFVFTINILLLFTIKVTGQTYDRPIHGVTMGYYNDKFGSHGMRVGYESPVWQNFRDGAEHSSLKHALILKANINFYNHKRHNTGLSVNVTIGYRYTSKAGLIIEPLHVGTGYLHSFLNGKTYEAKPDGSFQEVKLAGNSTFVLPYIQLIGLGYDFRQKSKLPLSFMMSLDPYFQHSVNTQTRIRLATPITMTYFFK